MAIIDRRPKVTDASGVSKPDSKAKKAFLVRIEVPDLESGARKQRVVGTYPTLKTAQDAERKALHARDTGTLLERSKATVGDVLRDWLRSKAATVTSNSSADYEQAVRLHLVPALGQVEAQRLTAARVQAQVDAWLSSGMKPRLAARCLMVLRQAFDQAERHGVVARNPAAAVKPPRVERRTVDVWTADEIAAFLAVAEARPILTRAGDTGRREPDPLWPLWPLLALEGLRKGEALGLRWSDVDFDRAVASIRQTVQADKANKGRVRIVPRTKTAAGARAVSLTTYSLIALREHRKRQLERRLASPNWIDHDLVVTTSTGGPVNPGGNVDRALTAIVRATKLPNGEPLRRIRIHDCRHSAATLMLANGVPLKIASTRLGHASVAITANLYSHVSDEMGASAAAAVGAAIDKARAKRSG